MLDTIIQNGPAIIDALWWIGTGLLGIAAITPTKADDAIIGRVVNLLSMVRIKRAVVG